MESQLLGWGAALHPPLSLFTPRKGADSAGEASLHIWDGFLELQDTMLRHSVLVPPVVALLMVVTPLPNHNV